MTTTASGQRPWIFAVIGALVVLLAIALLFRAPGNPRVAVVKTVPVPATPAKGVVITSFGGNEAALTDPTPLFLPTKWNAGENALPANTQREPGGSFQGYPAKLAFAETELKLDFPAVVVVPARPADAAASDRSGLWSMGVGQLDSTIPQLIARNAFIEILAGKTGERLLAQPLIDAVPPATAWQPMEFLVAVDAMGMVGPPILTESSRVAAVDGYFQNYLVKSLHAGQRLAPGFYRVCIGP